MEALRSADEIRDVNTKYHDVAASSYDSKWGIDFGEVGRGQVLGKLRKLLGSGVDRGYDRSLEIGAGTGYFSLNLLQAGVAAKRRQRSSPPIHRSVNALPATPAIADNTMYVRTAGHLYAFAEK